jgi:hypothetical protein
MTKPLIQIDDEVREMTDEEYAHYLEATTYDSEILQVTDETPSPD